MRRKNIERAEWARPAVELFAEETGLKIEDDGLDTAMGDLVADLMHLCDLEKIAWSEVLRVAESHYSAEQSALTE